MRSVTAYWATVLGVAILVAGLIAYCRPQVAPTPPPAEASPTVVIVAPVSPLPATSTPTETPYAPYLTEVPIRTLMPTATETSTPEPTPVPPTETPRPATPTAATQRG